VNEHWAASRALATSLGTGPEEVAAKRTCTHGAHITSGYCEAAEASRRTPGQQG